MAQKCVFLDRDSVINGDKVDYVYKIEDIKILEGVKEALHKLKNEGYLLIVITNQSGIDRDIYTENEVFATHNEIQNRIDKLVDEFYFSPYHRTVTASLGMKPGSLLFEKAISKYKIDVASSWMVGDRIRDLIPAEKLGIRTILLDSEYTDKATFVGNFANNLLDATNKFILN
jgi:D-glycero-D-manno-heptose 1,7-bisphosphate phosphatase